MSLTRSGWFWMFAIVLAGASTARAQFNDNTRMFGGNWEKSENHWQPFGPTGFEMDLQPFDIATFDDANEYDGADDFSIGWYFGYQRLNWATGRPDKLPLGDRNTMLVTGDGRTFLNQRNGRDIAVRNAPFHWGNRYEMGYWDGRTGWAASVLDLDHQLQQSLDTGLAINFVNPFVSFTTPGGEFVTITVLSGFVDADADGFDDDLNGNGRFGRWIDSNGDGTPDRLAPVTAGPGAGVDFEDTVVFPTNFDEVVTRNTVETSGVELSKTFRFRPFHKRGGILELYLGARYMEVNEAFRANMLGGFGNEFLNIGFTTDPLGNQVPLRVNSFIESLVDNNLVGPQLGGRLYWRRGAFNFATEARFMAAYNFQNIKLRGQLGGNIPLGVAVQGGNVNAVLPNAPAALDNSNFEHHAHFDEFAPTGEVRVQTAYNITKGIALKVGWTGIYSHGIARSANVIVYEVPHLGINTHNLEDYFATGVDFGVEWNR
jgi:hypothetical protein